MKIKKNSNGVVYLWTRLHNYLDEYLLLVRSVSHHTVIAYKESLNSFISFLTENKRIPRNKMDYTIFNRQNVKDYLAWMRHVRKLAPKTCNLRLTAIRAFLAYSAEEDMSLTHLQVEVGNVKNLTVPDKPIEYLQKVEMRALLNAVGSASKTMRRDRMMLIFEYDTALRVEELVNVQLRDLHIEKDNAFVSVIGKGRKMRNIPLMEKTICHLEKYLNEFHADSSMKSEAPLFYSRKNGKPHELSTDSIEKLLKKYAMLAKASVPNMPFSISCHTIRRTRAMDLYQAGIPLVYIAQVLGHKNISTTTGFYAFATIETLQEAFKQAAPMAFDEEAEWTSPAALNMLFRL
ncbi:MAG: site-specific integrase [Defluviitaleaceae bacterium]|nr:site-specific integrase [Defluviitaleaceae bacterium]